MTRSRSPVHPSPSPAASPARPPTRAPASTQSHRFLTPAGRGIALDSEGTARWSGFGVSVCVCVGTRAWDLRARRRSLPPRRRGGTPGRKQTGGGLLCCAAAAAQCGGGLPEVEGGARTRLGARKESIVLYKTRFFGRLGIAAVAAVGGLWWWGRGPAG